MLALTAASAAFVLPASQPASFAAVRATPASMGMFDGFAKAFANDDTLGARENGAEDKLPAPEMLNAHSCVFALQLVFPRRRTSGR